MSKVEVHYDTKNGNGHVMVDGKKVKDVKHVFLKLVHPDEADEFNKSSIHIDHHTKPEEEGDVHHGGYIHAGVGQDINISVHKIEDRPANVTDTAAPAQANGVDTNDWVGKPQGGADNLTYNYLGYPIKSPDATLVEALANVFAGKPNLLGIKHLNPEQVPHRATDKGPMTNS